MERQKVLLKAGALQNAILTSANFSIIATDEKGIIQLFNVGAERMLGYRAAEVVNRISPSDIHDPREVMARAQALIRAGGIPLAQVALLVGYADQSYFTRRFRLHIGMTPAAYAREFRGRRNRP